MNNYKVGFSLFMFIMVLSSIILYFVSFQHRISVKEGLSCDDGLAYTVNDKYHDGLCYGNVLNGTRCNDYKIQTINDKYKDGVCSGQNVQNFPCNDKNPLTKNDIFYNGVCEGTIPDGTVCNDGSKSTYNDHFTQGMCIGTQIGLAAINPNVINNQPEKEDSQEDKDDSIFIMMFGVAVLSVIVVLMSHSFKEDQR